MQGTKPIVLGAVGDIGFHRSLGQDMLARGIDWPFERVRDILARADLLFGNMESVALPPDFPRDQVDPQGLITPLSGEQAALALKEAGFHLMNMAANHVLDAGWEGMFYTRQCLHDAGLSVGGVGATQEEARTLTVVERGGVRFGFLCYCEDNNYALSTTGPGHAYYEVKAIVEDVQRSRDQVDILVVSIHADIEFMETPSLPRRAAARRIAEAGADIVLQHHPHVPQGVEMHQGSLIAYSLGNFVFDSHTSAYMRNHGPHTAHSFVLLVQVTGDGVQSFERVPIVIPPPPNERPIPAEGDAARSLDSYLRYLDQAVQDDELVAANWTRTAWSFMQRYAQAIGNAGPDIAIYDILSRLWFVAENRSVLDHVYAMAEEEWRLFAAGDNRYHRPLYRLRDKWTR